MARLKIKLRGKQVSDIPLEDGRSYIAGRKEDCDIVLQPEKGISREHFKISSQNGMWNLEVVSRYGDVIVAGEKLQNAQLEHGLRFSVPPYDFEFVMTSGDSLQSEASLVAAEAAHGHEDEKDDRTIVGVAPSIPYISVIDESGEVKELFRLEGGDTWTAGRDANCAVVIRDSKVSRKQFEVRKVSGQFYILDLGSVNGTLLNGVVLSDQLTPLKSADQIQVLENTLVFELRDPNFKVRMELAQVASFPTESEAPSGLYDPPSIMTATAPMPMSHESMLPSQGGFGDSQVPGHYIPPGHHPFPAPHQGGGHYPPVAEGKFDFQKHRPKLIVGVVLFLAIAYLFSDTSGDGGPKASQQQAQDPFSRLTPAEQTLVKQSYDLATSYYRSGKYELASQEIQKVLEKVPNYQNSAEIARLAAEGIRVNEARKENARLEAARLQQEQDILKQADICAQKMNPQITVAEVEECIAPVIAYNPEHPRLLDLKAQANAYELQRAEDEKKRSAYLSLVGQLGALYKSAEKVEASGQNLEAIAAYNKVVQSKLPDPNGLKAQAQSQISRIKKTMSVGTAKYEAEANKYYRAGNLKSAILTLRKAQKIDPTNEEVKEKINLWVAELKKQMMVLYQEGILEESFGNVEGGETRSGAKDKWKKILQLDVPDGEYYKKAFIKLKKYGAL